MTIDFFPYRSMRILNVNDDDGSREFKSTVLRSAGFVVDEAQTGLEALRQIGDSPPDAVLLDVHLPGLDGFEVCRRVKGNPRTEDVAIVLISAAYVTDEDWVRGLDCGADHYLIEPIGPDVLRRTLRQLLHRHRAALESQATGARTMQALSASEARYRELFFNAPYGIYTVAANGRMLSANRALTEMLGYESIDEVLVSSGAAFFEHPDDAERVLDAWRQSGQRERHEVKWKRRDGRSLVVRLTGRHLEELTDGVDAFEVFAADVTDQRRLEAEIRQSQKMEAVGRLAAGIAHDFNNLLTVILGMSETIMDRVDVKDPIHDDLEQIFAAGESAATLTRQLLAFGRKQTFELKLIDVNALVQDSVALIGRTLRDDIAVKVELAGKLECIDGDRVQLEQVLLNLAVNARDAMPDGGTLTIETAQIEISDARPFPWPVQVKPGWYIRLGMTDTGTGMDAETQRLVFDPFFTTKAPGQGTGLGLASVYGTVKQLNGYIWVGSQPGQGTTFWMYFPVSKGVSLSPAALGDRGEVAVAGHETLLVIEDQASVRSYIVGVLKGHGYKVLEADSPNAALALAKSHAGPIHLVLTDVIMPEMNGPTVFQRLQNLRRDLGPVIYISGYADAEVTAKLFDGSAVLLAKPFTQAALLQRTREALDRFGLGTIQG